MDWLWLASCYTECVSLYFLVCSPRSLGPFQKKHAVGQPHPTFDRPRQTLDAVIDGTFAMWEVESSPNQRAPPTWPTWPLSCDPTFRDSCSGRDLRKHGRDVPWNTCCKSFKTNSRLVVVGHFGSFVNENKKRVYWMWLILCEWLRANYGGRPWYKFWFSNYRHPSYELKNPAKSFAHPSTLKHIVGSS